MSKAEFHNALRILLNIDGFEFMAAVYPNGSEDQEAATENWERFKANPHLWFVRAPDVEAEAIWRLMQTRKPKNPRQNVLDTVALLADEGGGP